MFINQIKSKFHMTAGSNVGTFGKVSKIFTRDKGTGKEY